jgi:hypothetical protein
MTTDLDHPVAILRQPLLELEAQEVADIARARAAARNAATEAAA